LAAFSFRFCSCCRDWFVARPRQFCCDSKYTTEVYHEEIQCRCRLGWLG